MINNNPYNVPEKPLKQSKAPVQPSPLYPFQMNRRQQDVQYKHPVQMMKKSTIPIFLQASSKQSPRIPLSPQPILKGQHLQVSTVSPWDNGKQLSNISIYRELSDRLSQVVERLDLHQRKISSIVQVKKQQQSTTLSDSTYHSYEMSNAFSSRQMQRNGQSESFGQLTSQIAQVKLQLSNLKYEREVYNMQLKKELRQQMNEQKTIIAKELINSFRQSLNDKFAVQQSKINESILQIVKIEDLKLVNAISELKQMFNRQINRTLQDMKYMMNQQKPDFLLVDKIQEVANSFASHRTEYLHFKDHVFKTIIATHSQQQSLLKINQKVQLLSKIVQKKQVSLYEGYLNVSSEKNYNQIIKINVQTYLSATKAKQNTKSRILQATYYIDSEGFLLDSSSFYILNSKGSKIKIQQSEIRKLKDMGILK